MAYSGRLPLTVLVLCVAAAIACSGGSREELDTAGNQPPTDKCADFNGEGNGVVRGNLKGKGQAARSVARRIRGVDGNGKDHGAADDSVRLVPTCDNRTLERADLYEGRFVGLLTGKGLDSLGLSNTPNDLVAWWVYGETIADTSGGADTIWHSQFLSLRGPANSDPKNDTLVVCGPEQDHDDDTVDWHSDTCSDSIRILSGDKPWFGCKLGCCFSAMNIS